MFGRLLGLIYKARGWQIIGPVPTVPKALWAVVPHTSNWDFPVGLWLREEIGVPIGFLAKSSLFTWYLGWIFRALGGTPVYRDKSRNMVEAVIDTFNRHQTLHVSIAPEGTRENVDQLKTGFYYMALGANIPLILVGWDLATGRILISEPFYVTGDLDGDLEKMAAFYLTISPYRKAWLKKYEYLES
jgi:1-acyl-sn-glycerol-3-phosphate acyltransferase